MSMMRFYTDKFKMLGQILIGAMIIALVTVIFLCVALLFINYEMSHESVVLVLSSVLLIPAVAISALSPAIIRKFKTVIILDEEGIRTRSYYPGDPSIEWKDLRAITFGWVSLSLVSNANVWIKIDYTTAKHKEAWKTIVEQAQMYNPYVYIAPITLEKLEKAGVL